MLVRLCHSSRDRRKLGKCVLEGAHTILAYLDRFGVPELIVINEAALDAVEMRVIVERAGERQIIVADARLFSELAQTATPAGVLAVIAAPQPGSSLPGVFNLLLEDVQDPGNVGTMLRTAAAAGVTHVFLSQACAFAWSPKVLRAGQGAHFFLEIVEGADLTRIARGFSGRVVAAVPRAETSLFEADLRGPLMLIVGNEGAGLSAELIDCASAQVAIPMPGGVESLNAASAAAVCLFEKLRQENQLRKA
jgi:TrmH family RNA methyltransferase